MLKKIIIAVAMLTGTLPVTAAIGMKITTSRVMYMRHEPVYAMVTLRNNSGRPLLFGNDARLQGFLLFEIRDSHDRVVAKIPGRELSVNNLLLEPGQRRNLMVAVSDYYRLEKPDRYTIYAYVSHPMLESEYRTKDTAFEITDGITLWSKSVGIPVYDNEHFEVDGSQPVKERSYEIRELTENGQRYFYLVIIDKEKIYAVARIGKRIGREEYRADVDMLSRIHLLIPESPTVAHYMVFACDGSLLISEYRKTTDTIPTLVRNPDNGDIKLLGGRTAVAGRDYTDPRHGTVDAGEILEPGNGAGSSVRLAPLKYGGKVDLGQND